MVKVERRGYTLSPQMTFWYHPNFARECQWSWIFHFFLYFIICFLFVFMRKIGKDLTTILAQKYNIYRILSHSLACFAHLRTSFEQEYGGEKADGKRRKFDSIFSTNLIHHTEDIEKESVKCRLMEKGGGNFKKTIFYFSLKISCESQKFPFIFSKSSKNKFVWPKCFVSQFSHW